jgi:tRNA G46 methylase TrmB
MRRKKHLDERIELSSKYLLFFEPRSVYGRPNKDNYPNIDVKAVFGNDNPVYLEIGSGKGSFICQMA